ncbi:MAG: hypothetical protein ABII02_03055 [Candidatus Magasanikbacteria bacterium]
MKDTTLRSETGFSKEVGEGKRAEFVEELGENTEVNQGIQMLREQNERLMEKNNEMKHRIKQLEEQLVRAQEKIVTQVDEVDKDLESARVKDVIQDNLFLMKTDLKKVVELLDGLLQKGISFRFSRKKVMREVQGILEALLNDKTTKLSSLFSMETLKVFKDDWELTADFMGHDKERYGLKGQMYREHTRTFNHLVNREKRIRDDIQVGSLNRKNVRDYTNQFRQDVASVSKFVGND